MTHILRFTQRYFYSNNVKINNFNKNVNKYTTRYFSNSNLDINTNVAKDVILFKYDQPKFYKYMNIFAFSQYIFWGYLAYTVKTTLRDIPVDSTQKYKLPWYRKINLGEKKYKRGLYVSCILIGHGILLITWMYTLRSVRYLILRKGGKMATIVTYAPFGVNRMLTLDLKCVSCKDTRQTAKSQLPIKVKGHYFHYMLDVRGEFRNPALFDHTVGLRRNL